MPKSADRVASPRSVIATVEPPPQLIVAMVGRSRPFGGVVYAKAQATRGLSPAVQLTRCAECCGVHLAGRDDFSGGQAPPPAMALGRWFPGRADRDASPMRCRTPRGPQCALRLLQSARWAIMPDRWHKIGIGRPSPSWPFRPRPSCRRYPRWWCDRVALAARHLCHGTIASMLTCCAEHLFSHAMPELS